MHKIVPIILIAASLALGACERKVEEKKSSGRPATLITTTQAKAGTLDLTEQTLGAKRNLRDGEERGQCQALLLEHRGEVVPDLADRLRGHPVEDDRNRRTPFGCLTEQGPRDGIGIPGRSGDEQPEIGCRQELGGEVARGLAVGDQFEVLPVQVLNQIVGVDVERGHRDFAFGLAMDRYVWGDQHHVAHSYRTVRKVAHEDHRAVANRQESDTVIGGWRTQSASILSERLYRREPRSLLR